MKKVLLILALMLTTSIQAYAGFGRVENVISDTATTVVVTKATSVTTKVVKLSSGSEYGLWFQAVPTSSANAVCSGPQINACGNNNVKIELEMSYDTNPNNFAKPIGISPIISGLVASTPTVVFPTNAMPMQYGRFRITNGAATYDTVVAMKMFTRDL